MCPLMPQVQRNGEEDANGEFSSERRAPPLQCPECRSRLRFAYPGVSRTVRCLSGETALRQDYYACENLECPKHKPFRYESELVQEKKWYGLDVLEEVVYLRFQDHLSYRRISKILRRKMLRAPAPQTVCRMCETFLASEATQLEAAAPGVIQARGGAVLEVDGQRPENNRPSLWVFRDWATGAVLNALILPAADSPALERIFLGIEESSGYPIKAVVSDHQRSIAKAVEEALPGARHQFCHFHFLRNLALPLVAVDSHLHKLLEGGVNAMYIAKASPRQSPKLIGRWRCPLKTAFRPVMERLQAILAPESRLFDLWTGCDAYDAITAFVRELKKMKRRLPTEERYTIILGKTIGALEGALEAGKPFRDLLASMIPHLDEARALLARTEASADEARDLFQGWVETLRHVLGNAGHIRHDRKRRVTVLNFRCTQEQVLSQWIALAQHHQEGLFKFHETPEIPRTNCRIESLFSEMSMMLRQTSGKYRIGYMVRVYGPDLARHLSRPLDGSPRQIVLSGDRAAVERRRQFYASQRKKEGFRHRSPFTDTSAIKALGTIIQDQVEEGFSSV